MSKTAGNIPASDAPTGTHLPAADASTGKDRRTTGKASSSTESVAYFPDAAYFDELEQARSMREAVTQDAVKTLKQAGMTGVQAQAAVDSVFQQLTDAAKECGDPKTV